MKQSNIQSFNYLSNFSSIKDLNNNMESFLSCHKSDLTTGELHIFKELLRYSCVTIGVSNASIRTLLKSLQNKKIKLSEATFHRFKRKAVKFGILEIHSTERANGSQSSNVYVIQRFINSGTSISSSNDTRANDHTEPQTAPDQGSEIETMTPRKTDVIYKTYNKNINKRYKDLSHESHESFQSHELTSNKVPTTFKNLAKMLNNGYKQIESLWRVVTINTHHLTHYKSADKVSLAERSFYQLIRNMKAGRKIRNVEAYYTAICKNIIEADYHEWLFEEMYEAGV